MVRDYRIEFEDGSAEIVEAANIADARDLAKSLYPISPVRLVRVLEDDRVGSGVAGDEGDEDMDDATAEEDDGEEPDEEEIRA